MIFLWNKEQKRWAFPRKSIAWLFNAKQAILKTYILVALYRLNRLDIRTYMCICVHTHICINNLCKQKSWIWRRMERDIQEDMEGGNGRENCHYIIISRRKKTQVHLLIYSWKIMWYYYIVILKLSSFWSQKLMYKLLSFHFINLKQYVPRNSEV